MAFKNGIKSIQTAGYNGARVKKWQNSVHVVVECPLSSILKQWRHTFLIKKVQYVHKSLPTYSVFRWCNFSFMGRLCWIMVQSERWDTFQFIMTKWWNYIAFCEMNLVVTVLDLHNNPFSSFLSKTSTTLKKDRKILF